MSLLDWGFTPFFAAYAGEPEYRGLLVGRVIAQHRGLKRVRLEDREIWASVAGSLGHHAGSSAELPVVGDWVVVDPAIHDDRSRIQAVLPRRTRFSRKAAGEGTAEQVVAANLDAIWIVTSLPGDLNPRRLERYVALSRESGAAASIVLTKADLSDDVSGAVRAAEAVAPGIDVHAVSAKTGLGLENLAAALLPARTVALLGSSGVGKSTLINRLAGVEILRTAEVRAWDGRGRHTTTHREIVRLPNGALVVDTPGMRELALWDADEGTSETFPEIESLAEGCRFSDCRHEAEPDCAVRAAVENGTLDPARVDGFRRLVREMAYLDRKEDPKAQAAERSRWRAIHKSLRAHPKYKPK
jgi:ribosome biogenesis GTPase